MTAAPFRMPLVDALKAIAAQFVLLCHFSTYGPLAEAANEDFPTIFEWLYGYGRMAVQVFLVVAGFLAARGLSPHGQALPNFPLRLIWQRYLRLVLPYLAAIGLSIMAAAIADHLMDDESIPTRATFRQWLAHLFLLQNLLGFESLSAGVWYVAIDFQLFALMAVLLWAGRIRMLAPALVLALAVASLFWFNLDADWDNWALYFFGSYGLGAAAWWAADRRRSPFWLALIAVVVLMALIVDFRLRIGLALAVALLLGCGRRLGFLDTWPDARPLAFLGRISYSLFLVHFPVLLLANGLYAQFECSSAASVIITLLLAFAASIGAATLFHHWVESPQASRRLVTTLGWMLSRGRKLVRRLAF